MDTALAESARAAAVRPQDDLFRHVNGHWLAGVTIPEDRSSAGSFVDLAEQATADVRTIVEQLDATAGGDEGKLATLWAAYLDEARLEELGATPLAPLLALVDGISSPDDLARHWGWALRHQVGSIVGWYADADMDQPTRHMLNLVQSGLGLPDRDYYLDEQHAAIRESYRAHVERALALAGVDDATDEASLVVELETAIAALHWTRVQTRDIQARHNPTGWDEAVERTGALRLDEVFTGAEVAPGSVATVNLSQPSYLEAVGSLVTDDRMPQWRAWARWNIVRALSPYLSGEFVEAHFDFYGRTLQGTPQLMPRWKRGVSFVEGVMGEAVGRLYVERHFPAASKARADELVANLLAAYRASIQALDWMGEETRAEALHKLDGFRPKIGFPAHWRDYGALEVVPGDLVACVLASSRFDVAWMLEQLERPVDPDEWMMLPQTVNAYYHPLRNEIVFPAAILQPPFFDPDADDATNYGGIGAVIGHEIGHGFDDQGSSCDGDGRLRNWWTDDDRAAFTERTGRLVEQYDALVPRALSADDPAPHVNGRLTIGENIGDLGGLGIALKALAIALGSEPTPEQARALFTSYATIWRSTHRDERARQLLLVDPHSPAEFRCNQVVANIDAFHEAFGTVPGDGMWLDEDQRVSIW